MPIIASACEQHGKELIPPGNYIAICYEIIHIGTIHEFIMGEQKIVNKVRIGWELPTERRVFKEENGLQPFVISKDFTLSLHEKSSLRKTLASWRGRDFTVAEARAFDITALIDKPCMLSIVHKQSKTDVSRIYATIGSIGPIPRGIVVPQRTNPVRVLSFDNFNEELFNTLPNWLRDKISSSIEYRALKNVIAKTTRASNAGSEVNNESHRVVVDQSSDELPF